jgi:hypothetical protein
MENIEKDAELLFSGKYDILVRAQEGSDEINVSKLLRFLLLFVKDKIERERQFKKHKLEEE